MVRQSWNSFSSIDDEDFSSFASENFQPIEEIPNITPLCDMNSNDDTFFTFVDSEGLDYQTEYGVNYDVVSILPNLIMAENVFLVVTDRLNPEEVRNTIDKLAKAAEHTHGSLSFRNGKLFGHFTIIINKAQGYGQYKNMVCTMMEDFNLT